LGVEPSLEKKGPRVQNNY